MQIPIIFSVVLNPEVLFREIKILFCIQISHLGGKRIILALQIKTIKWVNNVILTKNSISCQSSIYLSIAIEISHIMGHFGTNSCMKAKWINPDNSPIIFRGLLYLGSFSNLCTKRTATIVPGLCEQIKKVALNVY